VHRTDTREAHGPLSERELDVLEALANGESSADAAKHLGMSHNALRDHLLHAMFKLGAQDRSSAMALAVRLHLVAPGSPVASDERDPHPG
jgi:DNA-binding CsgD family transcriptional regulator